MKMIEYKAWILCTFVQIPFKNCLSSLFFVHLSSYSKAYGRMGLAYSSVEKHKEAVDCFKKAIDIEPANESYRTNLKLAEDRLKSVGSPGLGKL